MSRQLRFGLMLPNAPDGDTLALARRAEELGFDLVAVHRDHPPAVGEHGSAPSVEMWTLLSWLAAATERIRIAPCVLSLPYRHPGVVAKMAESLHRLSGGRLVLTVGAGGDDAAAGALGLPVRDPTAKVAATEEALTVMRRLWEEPEVTFRGEHFHLEAARIAPRPATPIPLWLGAFGPRLVDVAGRRADGWLPSLFALPPEAAYERLARLRRTARRAGRDPDELVYGYNVPVHIDGGAEPAGGVVTGPAAAVAERLASFAEGGFTLLNLWPTGPSVEGQLERLAEQVLPAVSRAAGRSRPAAG